MIETETQEIHKVLHFWFGCEPGGDVPEEQGKVWWKKSDEFDQEIRDIFGSLRAQVAAGEKQHWLADHYGRLAYIIVIDQFSRNMHRDTPGMYDADHRALDAVKEGLSKELGKHYSYDEYCFFLMPLMHSEELEDQNLCVAMFESVVANCEAKNRETAESKLNYAIAHRDIVSRFGRFPHRNKILGRESTAEEAAFLTQPGSSF